MSINLNDLLSIEHQILEVHGFDVQVSFTKALRCNEREYKPIELDDINLISCKYQDHRGIWRDTGIRPSDVASAFTQNLIKKKVIRILEDAIKEDVDENEDYLESSFEDHLYDWGHLEDD